MDRIAVVHDWLTGMRGGERVLGAILEVLPGADLYTLLHIRGSVDPEIEARVKGVSFIQHFPFLKEYYRYYLPLFPRAIESLDLSGYDFVVSTSHCVAKGVTSGEGRCHISYIHSPMRYIWDLHDEYFGNGHGRRIPKWGMMLWRNYLKEWDLRSSERVDYFIANSKNVAGKIERYYGRSAEVLYPPVDTEFFSQGGKQEDCYLMVTALVPYKRVDIAMKVFSRIGRYLVVIGSGPEEKRLKGMAGKNIEFLGWQPREVIREYYRKCRAFIMPGEEDFGIAPVEAMACGRPVIAYGKGGALETVIPYNRNSEPSVGKSSLSPCPTGVLFEGQKVEGLADAVVLFESVENRFDPSAIRAHALNFDRSVFKEKFRAFLRDHAQKT